MAYLGYKNKAYREHKKEQEAVDTIASVPTKEEMEGMIRRTYMTNDEKLKDLGIEDQRESTN